MDLASIASLDVNNKALGWEPIKKETAKRMNFAPNWVYHNPKTNQAQVRVMRAEAGDFALSKPALTYHVKAENDGTIGKAYIVLIERDRSTVIARAAVKTVARNVTGIEALPSARDDLPPYYWLDENFEPKGPNEQEMPY